MSQDIFLQVIWFAFKTKKSTRSYQINLYIDVFYLKTSIIFEHFIYIKRKLDPTHNTMRVNYLVFCIKYGAKMTVDVKEIR